MFFAATSIADFLPVGADYPMSLDPFVRMMNIEISTLLARRC